jgi:hypothetical protein
MFLVLIPMMLSVFQFSPCVVAAEDHKNRESGDKRYESREERNDYRNRKRRQLEKEDDGNEVTGQTSAWLLVAANFTVVLSILVKSLSRYFSFEPKTISSIKRFNQLQKRHLMRFHYVLNPVALCMAGIHFSLSSCRSSPLPELGLICLAVMVFLGFTVKLRLAPKRIQRFLYRLHTGLASISVMIFLLVTGHMIVD